MFNLFPSRLWFPAFLLVCPFLSNPSVALAAETFGNFHTLGVVLDPPAGIKPGDIAEVRLYQVGSGVSRRLQNVVPVEDFGYFAGSVFHLSPDTEYQFRADFHNAAGKVIGQETFAGRTRAEATAAPPGTVEVHVSPTGDDSQPGDAAHPKQTIAAALKLAKRGGHVVLHAGVYHEGPIGVYAKATAAAPLVIRAAAGEQVVLDGSDPAAVVNGWKPQGNGYFSRAFAGDTHLICAQSDRTGAVRRMYRIDKQADFASRRAGQYRFDQFDIREAFHLAGGQLTIYCPYLKPGVSLRVSHRSGAFELSGASHIVLQDLTFRFYEGQGIYINDSSDVTVRGCRFEYINTPIAVKRKSDRLLVERCRFVDDCDRWGFLPKTADGANYSAWIETGAVYVHFPFDGRGLVVRDNEITGLFDGIHLTPSSASPKPRTSEIDFYRNKVTNVCDDFIEADGFSRNVRMFDNHMRGCLSGVSIAQAVHGPTYLVRNVIADFGSSSATKLPPHYQGYPIKTNGGDKHGLTGWVFVYHNTAVTTATQTNAFRVQAASWRRLVMANNIWSGTRDGFVFWRRGIAPMEMHRDLVFTQQGALLKIEKQSFAAPTAAQAAFAPFQNVLFDDPRLRSAKNGDYRLAEGSPAINAGVITPGINDQQFQGAAPDIGAIETKSPFAPRK